MSSLANQNCTSTACILCRSWKLACFIMFFDTEALLLQCGYMLNLTVHKVLCYIAIMCTNNISFQVPLLFYAECLLHRKIFGSHVWYILLTVLQF